MEHLPPVVTPFGSLSAPTGCTISHLRPRRAPLVVERLSETCPPAGLRRNLSVEPANDRFEREWEPLPWDDEPADRIEQLVRLIRKEMWQDRVKWFCVAVAVFAAVYFAAEFLR